ncbi:MAG: hypothetical protein ACI9U1_002137, partial [Porticoccaceae bacterium]
MLDVSLPISWRGALCNLKTVLCESVYVNLMIY